MNHRKNNCSSNVYPQTLSVYCQSENTEVDGDPKAIDFTLVEQLFQISHFYVLCGKLHIQLVIQSNFNNVKKEKYMYIYICKCVRINENQYSGKLKNLRGWGGITKFQGNLLIGQFHEMFDGEKPTRPSVNALRHLPTV